MNSRVKTAILSAVSAVLFVAATVPANAQKAAKNASTTATVNATAATGQLIVVSLKDRELALVDNGGVEAVYPVAVGKASTPSPTGVFTIVNHVKNPTYYRPGAVIPPGRWNPVGNRWMGLSVKGYGIHGTDVQSSVGKAVSHGCIRLRKHDIEALFAKVNVGTRVMILAQRDRETIALFGEPAGVKSPDAPSMVLAAKQGQKGAHATPVTETAEMTAPAMPAGR